LPATDTCSQDFVNEDASAVFAKTEDRLLASQGNRSRATISREEQRIHGQTDWSEKQHYTRLFYTHKYQSAATERIAKMEGNPDLKMKFDPYRSFELLAFDSENPDHKRQFSALWNRFLGGK
jgi:hypothetical protein